MLHPWLMTVFARRVFSSSAAFPWRGKFDWAAFPETRYPNKWGGAWSVGASQPEATEDRIMEPGTFKFYTYSQEEAEQWRQTLTSAPHLQA